MIILCSKWNMKVDKSKVDKFEMEVKYSIFGIIDPFDYSYSPSANFRIRPKNLRMSEDYCLEKLKLLIEDLEYDNLDSEIHE